MLSVFFAESIETCRTCKLKRGKRMIHGAGHFAVWCWYTFSGTVSRSRALSCFQDSCDANILYFEQRKFGCTEHRKSCVEWLSLYVVYGVWQGKGKGYQSYFTCAEGWGRSRKREVRGPLAQKTLESGFAWTEFNTVGGTDTRANLPAELLVFGCNSFLGDVCRNMICWRRSGKLGSKTCQAVC